jgi:hypothetical protein
MQVNEWFLKVVGKVKAAQLNNWNLGLAFLFAIQGVILLILSNAYSLPVTTSYLTADPLVSQTTGHTVLVTATQHFFDVNLIYLVAAFMFMAAVVHLLVATTYRVKYEADITNGINHARWFEYAFSTSIMIVIIGMLVGISDFSSLLMLFGLTVAMNLVGLTVELSQRGKRDKNRLALIISSLTGFLPWLVIAIYFASNRINGSSMPVYIYWLAGSMFILFLCFFANLLLQRQRKGKWADYLFGERIFMVLSVLAKTALAWQLFAGALH